MVQFLECLCDGPGQFWYIIEGVSIDKVIVIQHVVDPFGNHQTVGATHMLDQSMRLHRIGRVPVQIEMGYSDGVTPFLETMTLFLTFPLLDSTTPFPDQSLTIRFHLWYTRIVIGFQ